MSEITWSEMVEYRNMKKWRKWRYDVTFTFYKTQQHSSFTCGRPQKRTPHFFFSTNFGTY